MPLIGHQHFRDKAASLLDDLGIQKPPVDVYAIADTLGIEIMELTTPDWFSGALLNIKGDFYIVLNKKLPYGRKSLTIAHEIAHHQLHKEELCYLKNETKLHLQKEADIFADELVMPAFMVKAEANRWFNNSKFLAGLFGVKEAAIKKKMVKLGIIKPNGGVSF